jgi:hypothetical protein
MRLAPIALTLALAACSLLGCDQYSETSAIDQKIRLAQGGMDQDKSTRREFTHTARTQRPYVLAVLPTTGVTKETITALDLPREAKVWLTMEVDNRSLPGPLLGFLEADRAEWHPLSDGVTADQLLYAWKQPREELTIEMTIVGGRTLITSVR